MYSQHVLDSIRKDLHVEVFRWKERMLKKIQHDTEAMLEMLDANIERLHQIILDSKQR
jgi:hypothetical protein